MPQSTVRGIDHIGITVTDIEAATQFLTEAFGAQVIYRSFDPGDTPHGGADLVRDTGVAPGTIMRAQRLIKIGHGPDIELFEMHVADQREASRPSDIGVNHLAFYADDPQAAVERFVRSGGTILSAPKPVLFESEQGKGNLFCYGRTPWGMSVEFISYPSVMKYQEETPLRRWYGGN